MVFGVIGFWEALIILAVVLIIFGPKRLPEVAKAMGKAVNEFKKALSDEPKETKKKKKKKAG